ncbi:MAG TPA: class I tRNA ligase family protein [Panacibacter sp.]|nr:class I tRNA ligase family protein [Panacibacter sp.]
MTPKEYVDRIVATVKDLWKLLDVSYDRFIRTTDDYHVETCQKIFTQLYEQGDIYKGEYICHYCKPCESFWTDISCYAGNFCSEYTHVRRCNHWISSARNITTNAINRDIFVTEKYTGQCFYFNIF